MRVGIIADRLNRPLTGIGYYTCRLIYELSKLYNDIYLINYTKKNDDILQLDTIVIKNPIDFIKYPQSFYFWHIYLNYYLNHHKLDLDIIHSPENASLFVKLKYQKKVITIHDIIPFHFPETFTKITLWRYKLLLPKTLRTVDKIIAVSYNTKRDIVEYFKIPEDKIEVIYHGVDENYRLLPEMKVEYIKKKYNIITAPFILYVGTLEPRKNIPTLIKAYYKLKKQGLPHKLVITGKKGWKYREIFKLVDKLNLQKDVIFTGYVPEEDLPALYNAADLFVYPSLYEGFGLPPLEAMACGTPVITSNTSSLPEVVGDAGIMVDPYDVDGLARTMYEVLTNDGLREELRKRGLERAKLFSWKKCAEEHLKVYEEVYNMK